MKGLEKSALSVSAVAFFVSDLIKNQLGPVLIKGEISNLQTRNYSSYFRFSLKDINAKIDCLTQNHSNAGKILKHLKNGDEVIVLAQPSYYSKYGEISFFANEILKLGEGIFQNAFEKLKQKLYHEGLFNASRKRKLPKYPEKVGVITSADGAALQDILRVVEERYPIINIYIFPSVVQGKDAPSELYKALLKALNFSISLDAIIIGRGGGNHEDLNAFNDEKLVRLVVKSDIPIISAVGHEIDTTLIDYVSDLSAPTPTAAAMFLLPDKEELLNQFSSEKKNLYHRFCEKYKEEVSEIRYYKKEIHALFEKYLEKKRQELKVLRLTLEKSNPLYILKKGYAIILNDNLSVDNKIKIKTYNAIIEATINGIEDQNNE